MPQVLGGDQDELDVQDFDPIKYINRRFPDKASLAGLDRMIAEFEGEVAQLDESILETVREQSTAGAQAARDIADAKDSIGDLHAKIIEIKKKAEASEMMVQDICRDIKQLDVAKRHLTVAINTLSRLQTLTSAVRELEMHTSRRAYESVSVRACCHFPPLCVTSTAVPSPPCRLRPCSTPPCRCSRTSRTTVTCPRWQSWRTLWRLFGRACGGW